MHQELAHPPLSNTGVPHENCQSAHDWATAEIEEVRNRRWPEQAIGSSCPVEGREVRLDGICILMAPNYEEDFKKKLQELLHDDYAFVPADFGSRFYETRYDWLHGISLHTNPRSASNKGWFKCDFLGRAASQFDLDMWAELFLWVEERDGYPSSLQLNVDDFRYEVTPLQMQQAVEQPGEKYENECGNDISKGIVGFRTAKFVKSYGKSGGTSITFGKRGSNGGGKQYCCYDKNPESLGARNCTRHEMRFYDFKAKEMFKKLCEAAKSDGGVEVWWLSLIAGAIFGEVDFRDVSGYQSGKNKIKDCPRFEWWEKFVADSYSFALGGKKKIVLTYERAMKYLRKQVAPTMAMLYNCQAQRTECGTHVQRLFYELWDLGERNMNKQQRKVEAEYKSVYCKT